MKHTLVIKYIGEAIDTQIPFEDMLEEDCKNGWLGIVDASGKEIFVNTNNCKYFYFREEEKK